MELYKRGRISLKEFAAEKPDRDILVRLIVKKKPARMAYISQRNSSTDFPVLTCAVSIKEDGNVKVAVGACPFRAKLVEDKENILKGFLSMEASEKKRQPATLPFLQKSR